MTTETFTAKNFQRSTGSEQWMTYIRADGQSVFIARAKYQAQRKMLTQIKKALIGKSVDRWIELLDEHAPAIAIKLI